MRAAKKDIMPEIVSDEDYHAKNLLEKNCYYRTNKIQEKVAFFTYSIILQLFETFVVDLECSDHMANNIFLKPNLT